MKIVAYPENITQKLSAIYAEMIGNGLVAEGVYYNETSIKYIDGKKSIPVNSGGSAIFALLAYQRHVNGKTHAIIQSNTMRALYTIPRLLDMEVIVCDSSKKPGFMAMDPNALKDLLKQIKYKDLSDKVVVLYSVIGGYLSLGYNEIETICKENNIPLIVDMAHGHYLDRAINSSYANLAFSFYATKILPTGEGGLITTSNESVFSWIKRFLAYDRFNYKLEVGINLRASEFTACFIHLLMIDKSMKEFFRDRRTQIADVFKKICIQNEITFLDYSEALDYNGYKFIVFDSYEDVRKKNTILTKYERTSPVFAVNVFDGKPLLPHWCPPTYPSLYEEILNQNV